MGLFSRMKVRMPTPEEALPGRGEPMPVPGRALRARHAARAPVPGGLEQALFGMGCFWGAERKFWSSRASTPRPSATPAGYTPNPTYDEVCSARTGHNEVVLVVFDPARDVATRRSCSMFWEGHDPTQGMRQGNDVGTQYRSGIYVYSERAARGGRGVARRVPGAR